MIDSGRTPMGDTLGQIGVAVLAISIVSLKNLLPFRMSHFHLLLHVAVPLNGWGGRYPRMPSMLSMHSSKGTSSPFWKNTIQPPLSPPPPSRTSRRPRVTEIVTERYKAWRIPSGAIGERLGLVVLLRLCRERASTFSRCEFAPSLPFRDTVRGHSARRAP